MTEFSSVFSLVPQNISDINVEQKCRWFWILLNFSWWYKMFEENAVNSGEIFGNFKISTFSIEYSGATVRDIDINP